MVCALLNCACLAVSRTANFRIDTNYQIAAAHLFCRVSTIMARALLNFGFLTYRSPHHGSKICQRNSHLGAAR